ncbi:sialidase [Sphingobacterium psychroaquaticum]|uniref:prolyl oligopeptidase family serine peptidase n=1 Tax=Sphingobacterium psychroaquaticum TaxID=561061 RepID=UPI00106CF7A6|nr:prolyl oligopeptidase family serine peptidase [Sphingobacterium psychroaquaticum]QBQ42631.1 sialidase [Sphingobacterium psychroaquaticum]
MKNYLLRLMCLIVLFGGLKTLYGQKGPHKKEIWKEIAPYFNPPEVYADQYGDYRSIWQNKDARVLETAEGWTSQRKVIKDKWMKLLGNWPSFITDQTLELLDSIVHTDYTQYKVRFRWLPEEYTEGYLLVPHQEGPKAAVITVFYEPETAIGEGKEGRDFALQLCRRGFVCLSLGTTETTANKTYSLYYPSIDNATTQPLSVLAYAAANAWHALAKFPAVDSARIGIMGHSYGGKWAMFTSCLFDRFACAVWSDPGIVFDETKGSGVNYWEPWYLGYYPPPWTNAWRQQGMVPEARGLYPHLVREKEDLHELHALMAPRPFLVSGGSSDPVERWIPLNHSIHLNKVLGYKNRVAMTNRKEHAPNQQSNRAAFLFFEYFLK